MSFYDLAWTFDLGHVAVYKGNKYIVIGHSRMKDSACGWVPAYTYVNMGGESFSREKTDFETKFVQGKP